MAQHPCSSDGNGNLDVQGCVTTPGVGWRSGSTVSLIKPTNCPIKITGAVTLPFAATASVPYAVDHYVVVVSDRNDANTQWSYSHSYELAGNGTVGIFQISGSYLAGHGGFAGDGTGHDLWSHEFYSTGTGYAHAITRLTYANGSPGAAVVGPLGGIAAFSTYTVQASTDDPIMEGPVTWAFYVDGSFVGNSSDGYFTWNAGDQGYTQQVDAVITDANAVTHTGTTFVTACTGNQITC